MQRQRISSAAPWESAVGYSRAVRVGRHVVVSGTTAVDENGDVVGPGDPYRQAMRCIEIIGAALAEAGGSLEDVVRTRMYLTRIDDWDAVARAHGEAFGSIRPASTLLAVARLIDPGMLIEMEADAIIGDGTD